LKKRTRRKSHSERVGQSTIFGEIEGLDKLVNKPKVIEENGQRVISLVVKEADIKVPGYVEQALKIARQLQPEIQSDSKPPWMRADWQAKRRKKLNYASEQDAYVK
jgi:hypothetical protein